MEPVSSPSGLEQHYYSSSVELEPWLPAFSYIFESQKIEAGRGTWRYLIQDPLQRSNFKVSLDCTGYCWVLTDLRTVRFPNLPRQPVTVLPSSEVICFSCMQVEVASCPFRVYF